MSVAADELTGTEQAVLLVLMAESRPVANPELERLGPKLDKPARDRLNRLGLIETTPGRPLVHELTDAGWALCREVIGADVPARASGQGKALYTLLKALGRYFGRADLSPSDVFLPAGDLPPSGGPDMQVRIRRAYADLTPKPGGWVGLLGLRGALSDVARGDLDAALVTLHRAADVSLIPEENQKTLTDAEHAAAVRVGNQDRHLIAIQP